MQGSAVVEGGRGYSIPHCDIWQVGCIGDGGHTYQWREREGRKKRKKVAQLLARAAIAASMEASPRLPSSHRQTTSTYSVQQS